MDIPAPVDLNRLKNILGGAKAVMNKAQENNPVTPNISAAAAPRAQGHAPMNEQGEMEYLTELPAHLQTQQHNPAAAAAPVHIDESGRGHYNNLNNSKLPQNIKDAMINNPMPQLSMGDANASFALSSELLEHVNPQGQRPQQAAPQQAAPQQAAPKIMYENRQPAATQKGDMITVSESILRGIMKEELMKFMATTFTKQLKEETIKKTINTLIKEGKIKASTKKRVS